MEDELSQLINTAIKVCQTRSYVTPAVLKRALKTDFTKAEKVFGELEKMGVLSYFWAREYEGIQMSKVDRKKLREFLIN
jgi:ribosomal protein S25